MSDVAPLSDRRVSFDPRWVLPDATGLAFLEENATITPHRCGVAMVGVMADAMVNGPLVLVEIDDLSAEELHTLLRGTTRIATSRVTPLPATLDPALACVAPSLARARRFEVDVNDQPGGVIECARIEAQRRRMVETITRSEPDFGSLTVVTSRSRHAGSELENTELAEAFEVLVAQPALYRPVLGAAFCHDEMDQLRAWLHETSPHGSSELLESAGRVILRTASNTMVHTPDTAREAVRAVTPESRQVAARPGSPAERALEKVATVGAYRRGKMASGAGSAGKLSANESPFGPPPAVRDALLVALEDLNRYPEEGPVLDRLASHLDIDIERLILTNGSDELCYLLARLLLDDAPGSSGPRRQGFVVVGDPCYQIDATASTLAGAPIVRVPLVKGAHDLSTMAQAARQGATLVWLPSPHNPTGVTVALEELETFLDEVPGDCLVVLDEAYVSFAENQNPRAALALAESRANLLIQRTFSKDWALAGLRVGYAVGDAALIDALRRARPPFSVNALALVAVSAALESTEWRDAMVARIIAERALLQSTLMELGVEYFPSRANFVTCALAFEGVRDALLPEGLSVRDGADLGLPGWTRITIGWAPQMATLRHVLRGLVATAAPGLDDSVPQ